MVGDIQDAELRRAKKGKASSCAPALSQQSNLMLGNSHRWEGEGERENSLHTFALNIGSSASQEWWICDTPRAYVLVVCTWEEPSTVLNKPLSLEKTGEHDSRSRRTGSQVHACCAASTKDGS